MRILRIYLPILFFLIIFSPQFVNAQDSTSVDTLIAWYPFSGNAEDSSGFENHATIHGASLTYDRFGTPNSAYLFDGIDDYIEIPDTSIYSATTKTIEFWFKKNTSEIEGYGGYYVEGLLWKSFDTGFNRDFSFSIGGKSSPPFDVYNNIGNGTDYYVETRVEDIIESHEWYHITGIIDSSTSELYVNGKHALTVEHQEGVTFSGAPISVGRASTDSKLERYFKGVIDDIRIYNYAIDSLEIEELYTEKGWPDTKWVAPDTLLAYYPFSGNPKDSSGFNNDGVVNGAELSRDRFGNPNSAFSFDGVDDYIYIEDSPNLTPETQKLSISVWFRTSFPGDRFILYKGSDRYDREYAMGVRSDSLASFQINGNGDWQNRESVQSFKLVEENVWNHLVGVWTGDSLSIYLNNEKGAVQKTNLTIEDFNSGLYIGTYGGSANFSPNQYAFRGELDDIRIYNYALSDSIISHLYYENGWPESAEPVIVPNDTLAAFYPFNGDAFDSSGYNNHGQIYGASLTEDRFGEYGFAFSFDGDNDFIEIENPEKFHTYKNLSFSFWAKGVSTDSSFIGLITKKNMNPFGIAIDDGDRIVFTINSEEIPLNLKVEGLYTDPDEWYQYVAVFRGGEYLKVFRNGYEIGSLIGSIPREIDITSENILFGALQIESEVETDTVFFKGALDEVRFYNYDLTSEEIVELYLQETTQTTDTESETFIPERLQLHQNYPNPFNPSTTIRFDLPQRAHVQLRVYDITGRVVKRLVDHNLSSGSYNVKLDARDLSSGVYIYELIADDFKQVKKFTLIK